MKKHIRINNADNVIIALSSIKKGENINVDNVEIVANEDILGGHKISLTDIGKGENIVKYGFPIGHAIKDIKSGSHVHTHNIKTNLESTLQYKYNKNIKELQFENDKRTFNGYKRKDGSVGIRNELWIVPTVGCVNGTAQKILDIFKKEVHPQNIDFMEVFKHTYGCSQLGDDHNNTKTILADIVKHPNAGGVLVLGLGCENNLIEEFKESLGEYDKERILFLESQSVQNEIEEGVKLLKKLYSIAKNDKREPVLLSELKVGLKCGGSDGLSGITANPLVGAFSDYIVSQKGTAILTEVPEMFGAETILMERAQSEGVYQNIVELINNFKKYFESYNEPIYENPSPGNKKGGISTLEEKSLGCTQKGGIAAVVDVLKYGQKASEKGLNLLNAPGNDLVASTALAASGCQIVLFTTGRGTPFGTFVPTVKISTNTDIYNSKSHWIDFNAGTLVEDMTIEELLNYFINYIIDVADGKKTNNEINNFQEISIFKNGVTL